MGNKKLFELNTYHFEFCWKIKGEPRIIGGNDEWRRQEISEAS